MKLVSDFGMQIDDAANFIGTVIDGGVNLLLGAGASFGAHGGDKTELKGGADLAEDLNALFRLGLEKPDSGNLPLVYGDIAEQQLLKPRLNNFLRNRFFRCTPSWQSILYTLNWKRIWTLNIDDVLERSMPSTLRRTLSQHLWCDPFRPRTLTGEELQLIYLHGKASLLDSKPDHLIFSLKEYAARQETTPGWHAEFRSEFVKKPFIICGAKLQDEYDLIAVLEFGNRSRERGGCPSVVVLRDFAPGQAERYARQGLIPVRAKGDVFFKALIEDVEARLRTIPTETESHTLARPEILSKFKSLKLSELRPKKPLDFYASAETQWVHIQDNLDAHFYVVEASVTWLAEDTDTTPRVSLISGGSISGKTAAAYRIAERLVSKGYEVWQFRGEERFSEDSLVQFIDSSKKIAFLFDDCSDFSGSIGCVIEKARKLRRKLRIVATCETPRLRAVQMDLMDADVKPFSLEPLFRNDFSALFSKREQKGRLGRLTGSSLNDSWKEFNKHYNRRLLEWLESLENAHSYRETIEKILSSPQSGGADARNLICASAAVHRFGYSLPFHIADDYVTHRSLENMVAEDGALDGLGYLDEKGLRLRSSAFSRFVWGKIGVTERYNWSREIVARLSPLIVPLSISRRTLAYLIVKSLMDWETVKIDMRDNAESWYSSLEDLYGWNARFWEQRALLASDRNQESMAYSYAKRAVTLHGTDPFPHTTLGKVCIKIGLARTDAVGVSRFWEGVGALDTSRKLALEKGHEWEHPYITFFTYAQKAISLPHFHAEKSSLIQAWTEWMRAAEKSRTLTFDESGRSSLEDYQRRWLLAAVASK